MACLECNNNGIPANPILNPVQYPPDPDNPPGGECGGITISWECVIYRGNTVLRFGVQPGENLLQAWQKLSDQAGLTEAEVMQIVSGMFADSDTIGFEYDPVENKIIATYTGAVVGAPQVTIEQIQDAIGQAMEDSQSIDTIYNDPDNKFRFEVKAGFINDLIDAKIKTDEELQDFIAQMFTGQPGVTYDDTLGKIFLSFSGGDPGGAGGDPYIFDPVANIAAMLALDVTNATDFPDRGVIYVENQEDFFALDRDGVHTVDNVDVFAASPSGYWVRKKETVEQPALIENTLYVSPTGDDNTGLRNRPDKPFSSLTAANAAAEINDLIFVYPGVYAETNIFKSQVQYYFFDGAIVEPGDGIPAVDDRNSEAISCTVRGMGEFRGKGSAVNDSTTFVIALETFLDIECKRIESIEIWHPQANVIIRNAIIDFEFSIYGQGTCTLFDCRLRNSVNVVFGQGKLYAKDTIIENNIRSNTGYEDLSEKYVSERSAFITNLNIGGQGSAGFVVLDNCKLISEHENININVVSTITHRETDMVVNLTTQGTTFETQTVDCRSYANRAGTGQVVAFMGISYANADTTVAPAAITNSFVGAGLIVEPTLTKEMLRLTLN